MRTENLAIVFVDIAGFTPRTSAQTREENLRMLRRFDGMVRPLVRAYRGLVVKTIGDAYLPTFRSPTKARILLVAGRGPSVTNGPGRDHRGDDRPRGPADLGAHAEANAGA